MNKGFVFSIEEFSVFDGPGIRTSVFLMGCPLRCEWCHNPEGQGFSNFIMRSPNGCVGCGECIKHSTERKGRVEFGEDSIKSCPKGLLRYAAKEYSATELCELLGKEYNGYLADTPGFSLLDFERFDFFELEDLFATFREFEDSVGKCKYTKCSHTKEDGCDVISRVKNGEIEKSRHESYCELYTTLKNKPKWK